MVEESIRQDCSNRLEEMETEEIEDGGEGGGSTVDGPHE